MVTADGGGKSVPYSILPQTGPLTQFKRKQLRDEVLTPLHYMQSNLVPLANGFYWINTEFLRVALPVYSLWTNLLLSPSLFNLSPQLLLINLPCPYLSELR